MEKRGETSADPDELQPDVSDGGTGVEEEDTSGVEITEPFNPALIRVESKSLIIDALLRRIKHGEIDMAPGFQRKPGIWDNDAQSRLIESILVRIPLPAFYMDATDEDSWLVVDGLQRLTTLKRFVLERSLTLSGLEFLCELEGKTFDQLPRTYQRRIEETEVTLYLIEKGTPPEVKFNVFKRINTGGLPLSAQEIRHALNQGPAVKFLQKLATSEAFLRATGNSIRDERMADREFALRFAAFSLTPYENYSTREDLDSFLNKVMGELNKMREKDIGELKNRFERAMEAAHRVLGRHAFRKLYKFNAHNRYPINKALFEAWSANFDRLSNKDLQVLAERKDEVNKRFVKLLTTDREFEAAISQGTGDPRKVHKRFSALEALLREVLDD